MNKLDIDSLMDRYLSGKATLEDERILREAAKDDSTLVQTIYKQSLLEQDLKTLFRSYNAGVPGTTPRSRRLFPVLAAAATVLVAVGIGTAIWKTHPPAPTTLVAKIHGYAQPLVLQNGKTNAASVGLALRPGDQIYLDGPGAVSIETPVEAITVTLSHRGRLKLKNGNQYALTSGRITVVCASRQQRAPIRFTTPLAQAEVVGTRFILKTSASHTSLRTTEGRVLFRDLRNQRDVAVAAGECAMVHRDNEGMFKDSYSPGKILEGRILFSDDFENGLDKWKACVVSKDGEISPLPGQTKPFASWKQVKREGQDSGCMELHGVKALPLGLASMIPKTLTLTRQFVFEMDVFYFTGRDASTLSFFSHYWDQPEGTRGWSYHNPQTGQLFSQMAKDGRWGRLRVLYLDADDPRGICLSRTQSSLDGVTVDIVSFAERLPPRIALKPRKGRVMVDNVIVKELISFE